MALHGAKQGTREDSTGARGVKQHALEEVNTGANLVRVGVLQAEELSGLRDPHGAKARKPAFVEGCWSFSSGEGQLTFLVFLLIVPFWVMLRKVSKAFCPDGWAGPGKRGWGSHSG